MELTNIRFIFLIILALSGNFGHQVMQPDFHKYLPPKKALNSTI